MKTITEAAEEYSKKQSLDFPDASSRELMTEEEIAGWIRDAVMHGAKLAEQWIDVNDVLPEVKAELYQILAEKKSGGVTCYFIGDLCDVEAISDFCTKWRPLNRE